MPTVPTDPQFVNQWHLTAIGNITRIWDDYRGGGVRVGVYDDGIERAHTDLDDNYNAALHVVFGGVTFDGNVHADADEHGTSVAGLIGAEANDSGTVGIAYEADLTGVNIFDTTSALNINAATPTGFFAAVVQSANFDIVNNSWGSLASFAPSQNVNVANSFTANTLAGWDSAVDNGRGGLGTIVVKSAGNDSRNASADGLNGSRFTITVAASSNFDRVASYSNHGSSILVTAPGSEFGTGSLGITTTDRTGTLGYNLRADTAANSDFTDDFGGTSAAAPIVSGVVTLMLDANESLGWRDVQNILSYSSTHLGGALDGSAQVANENGRWAFNGAENWNGGGLHVHTNYGYGIVDVYNAVRMAEVWSLFTPAQTSANEQSITVTDSTVIAIADLATISTTFTVASGLEIEHLALTINTTHTFYGDLAITLFAPDGSNYVLSDGAIAVSRSGTVSWTYGLDHLRGVDSGGVWRLEIRDDEAGDAGTLNSISATFYGTTADADDVYHFTDEFAVALALDATRATLVDGDGGIDWINLAAVTGNVVADLTDLAQWTLNGAAYLQIGDGAVFENVVTGDGNDFITGNDADNALHGMRGDDTLFGEGGDDVLDGGVGEDTLTGGTGNDRYHVAQTGDAVVEVGDEGSDLVFATINYVLTDNVEDLTLLGAALNGTGNMLGNSITGTSGDNGLYGDGGNDILVGGDGNDLLDGGLGDDQMTGGSDNDQYFVDSSDDAVIENANEGIDQVSASVSFTLTANVENLILTGAAAINGTGNGDGNFIQGNDGDNILDGAGGNDLLRGGDGNDIYVLDSLGDIVNETRPEGGTDTVRIGSSYTLGDRVENLELQGSGNIDGTGNELANDITGTNGTNVLDGGAGDDILRGRGGNDVYIVDSLNDVVIELANEGRDDRVETSMASYTLPDNVEFLEYTGTDAFTAIGNAGAAYMVGGVAGDTLSGMDGDDTLAGEAGDDMLNGGNGSDRLFGGAGADLMNGDAGNDRIVVDNAGDVANGGSGIDTVQFTVAGLTYVLASDVEIVSNHSGGDLTLTMNAAGNSYGGSVGVDIVMLGGGGDTANGRGGDDQFFGEGGNDYLYGEAGIDTLDGGDGNDFLYSGVDGDTVLGGAGNDTVYGQDGDDLITGGSGIDQLFGGTGGDRFIYTAIGDTGATNATADRIRDFAQAQFDRIDLSTIDALSGGGDDAFSFIGSAAFGNVAGELRFQQISGATYVQGDIDGNGVADFIIRVDGVHVLTAGDFLL